MKIRARHFRDEEKFDAKLKFNKDLRVTKAGKTFKMYDAIQEANVDTDIYEVARKYGMVGAETECAEMYMRKNLQNLTEDMQEFQDLRAVLDKQIKAQNMWNDLPLELKKQFNHNVNEFMEQGPAWLEKENQKWQEEIKKQQAAVEALKNKVNNTVTGGADEQK